MPSLMRPVLAAIVLLLVCPLLRAADTPRILTSSGEDLARAKQKFAAGDDQTKEVVDDIKKEAEKALAVGRLSVIDKSATPPSGDKHDYMSLSPYWWPDPSA